MFRAVFVVLLATPAGAQNASPDTQALQALVTEIRQLRQDLQSTTIVTQRVQIVLYRLQTQTALATHASSRLDDARASLGNAQSETKRVTGFIPLMEEDTKGTQDAAQRKAKEETLAQ